MVELHYSKKDAEDFIAQWERCFSEDIPSKLNKEYRRLKYLFKNVQPNEHLTIKISSIGPGILVLTPHSLSHFYKDSSKLAFFLYKTIMLINPANAKLFYDVRDIFKDLP